MTPGGEYALSGWLTFLNHFYCSHNREFKLYRTEKRARASRRGLKYCRNCKQKQRCLDVSIVLVAETEAQREKSADSALSAASTNSPRALRALPAGISAAGDLRLITTRPTLIS